VSFDFGDDKCSDNWRIGKLVCFVLFFERERKGERGITVYNSGANDDGTPHPQ